MKKLSSCKLLVGAVYFVALLYFNITSLSLFNGIHCLPLFHFWASILHFSIAVKKKNKFPSYTVVCKFFFILKMIMLMKPDEAFLRKTEDAENSKGKRGGWGIGKH